MTETTTLKVQFVSESAGYKNSFGWYNKKTGAGGMLFASVEAEGRHPIVRAGDSIEFKVATAELADIEYFLIPNGGGRCDNTAAELSGPIQVVRLANGTFAVATVGADGHVQTDRRGQPNILTGNGANALFTETSKNAGGIDYASNKVGRAQTAASLAGDTADGPTGLMAWEDLAATRKADGSYTKPGDADYNDAVFNIAIDAHAPVAADDAATLAEDTSILIDVLANDTDADGNRLSILAGSVSADHGTAVIENGMIRFTPDANYNGSATIGYRASDGGLASNVALVALTVTPVNDAASIAGVAAGTVVEDGTTTTGGKLVVSDADAGEAAFQVPASLAGTYGTFTFDASAGDWSYTLDNTNVSVQALNSGQSVHDTLLVSSLDGTASRTIDVTINGADEPAKTGGIDIVEPGWHGDAHISFNDGTGQFPTGEMISSGPPPGVQWGIALGDINGDGWLDVVTTEALSSPVNVTLFTGHGNNYSAGIPVALNSIPNRFGYTHWGVALGDLNHDGTLDIVGSDYTGGADYTLNDSVLFSFNPTFTVLMPEDFHYGVAVGDLNGDGWLDIVTSAYHGGADVSLNLQGKGVFDPYFDTGHLAPISGDGHVGIALGDVNNDGLLDIVSTDYDYGAAVSLNTGGGNFVAGARVAMGGADHYAVALGDLNGDGWLDLVTSDFHGGAEVSFNLKTADGSFGPAMALAVDGQHYDVKLGDMNADGWLDIVLNNFNSGPDLFLNTGNGSFAAPVLVSTGIGGLAIALGDMDTQHSPNSLPDMFGATPAKP